MSALGCFILRYVKPNDKGNELSQGVSSDDLFKTLNNVLEL